MALSANTLRYIEKLLPVGLLTPREIANKAFEELIVSDEAHDIIIAEIIRLPGSVKEELVKLADTTRADQYKFWEIRVRLPVIPAVQFDPARVKRICDLLRPAK